MILRTVVVLPAGKYCVHSVVYSVHVVTEYSNRAYRQFSSQYIAGYVGRTFVLSLATMIGIYSGLRYVDAW